MIRLMFNLCLLLLISCNDDRIFKIYYFNHDFRTPIGVSCSKIDSFGGVRLLEFNNIPKQEVKIYFDVLSKYKDEVYGDYRNKLIYGKYFVCTDINTLIDSNTKIPIEDKEIIKQLKHLIIQNEHKAQDINPLPTPFLPKNKLNKKG